VGVSLATSPDRSGRDRDGRTPAPILIADADKAWRSKIAHLLHGAGFDTREVGTGEEALEAAREERPGLVVLDVRLPDVSGYMVCRQLRDDFGEDLPIILLSADRTESFDRMAGLLIGADEYFAKPFPADEFVFRVRRFARRSVPPAPKATSTLSARELEILRLLASGLGQKQIARELHVSPKTVNTHVERIYEKLGVHSRTQAVRLAFKDGLVDAAS
jgi:two-component system nitrate/nitrite response regulator NarL